MLITRERISLEITLPPYRQTKASIRSSADGFVSLEPKNYLGATYNVRMSYGEAEDLAERSFEVFLNNFAKFERRLSKRMVFSNAIKSPLTFLPVCEYLGK